VLPFQCFMDSHIKGKLEDDPFFVLKKKFEGDKKKIKNLCRSKLYKLAFRGYKVQCLINKPEQYSNYSLMYPIVKKLAKSYMNIYPYNVNGFYIKDDERSINLMYRIAKFQLVKKLLINL